MAEKIHDLGNGAWNIRGDLRMFGLLNIGTQCSLIQLSEDRFVFLDSYKLSGDERDKVMALTDNGAKVEAVLNVHPFHTLYCAQMAEDFPAARFYGSARHKEQVPEVDWEHDEVETPEVAEEYPELKFSLPEGISYISDNEKVHAGSLLVYHPPSGMLHVDDTFNAPPVPEFVRRVFKMKPISLHPTLEQAMHSRPGSGEAFCAWAERIADEWSGTRWLCAAHSRMVEFAPGEFSAVLRELISKNRDKLTS